MPTSPSPHFPKFLMLIYRFRWPLAMLWLTICFGLFGVGAVRIVKFSKQVDSLKDTPPEKFEPRVFDSRLEIWFDEADPALGAFFELEKEFIPDDIVLVAFQEKEDPWGVFGERPLATIARLTERIDKVPYVRNVRSLTSAPWVRWGEAGPDEEGLLITDIFEEKPETYSADERLRRMIAVLGAHRAAALAGEQEVRRLLGPEANFDDYIGEPRYLNAIVSEDGRTAALQVEVLRERLSPEVVDKTFGDDPTARAVGPAMHANETQWLALDGIHEALSREAYEFHVVGLPEWQRNFMDTGMADMKWVGASFLVLSLLLFFLYRRKSAVAIPILVVNAAVMGMIGTMFVIGDLISNITSVAPTVVTAVGIADAVHLVSAYFLLRPGFTDKRALILTTMQRNALPIFLTSITTAVGFFAMTTSSIWPLAQFGYTCGIGVLFAYVISMTVVPALLSLIPVGHETGGRKPKRIPSDDYATPYWTDHIVQFALRRRKQIIIISLIVLVGATYSAFQVQFNNDYRNWFTDDNRVISDVRWLEDRIGGVGDVEIVFSAPPATEDQSEVTARQKRIEALEIRQLRNPSNAPEPAATREGDRKVRDNADAPAGEGSAPAANDGDAEGDIIEGDLTEDREAGADVPRLPPLSPDERTELARLKEEEARYQRQRIAVSSEFLSLVDRFERRLHEEMADPKSPVSKIRKVNSGLDVLRTINQVQNQNRAEYYRIPTDADVPPEARSAALGYDEISEEFYLVPAQDASSLAAQYYIQYENGAKPAENLSRLISADRRSFRLAIRADQGESKTHVAAFDRIREILRTDFPELLGTTEQVRRGEALASMVMTGKLYLFAVSIDEIASNILRSLAIALSIITLLLMIIYRSAKLGLISMIPNVLPLAVPLAFLGLLGIPIDGAVSLTVLIALGVAVDDTIHLLTKFKQARNDGLNAEDALRAAMRRTGTALTFTTIILVAGFGIMAFSEFRPNIMIGKLAVVMIGLAWVADMLLTPALLSYFPGGVALKTPMAPVPKATLVGEQKSAEASPSRSAVSAATTGNDFHTLVIGAGQCGLATGFFLSRAGVDYTILEAGDRVGDSWRDRWDSLRLFTPARYNSLPGLPFRTGGNEDWYRPTKDETADYLEHYASHFSLPIRYGHRVRSVGWEDGRYVVTTDKDQTLRADNVVVTTGFFTEPRIPAFAKELDRSIMQLHSREYRNPGQLNDGDVLVVGAGTSGCEIGIELVKSRRVYLAGDGHGRIPRKILGLNVFWLFPFVSSRPKTSFIGKKFHDSVASKGWPLVRFTYRDVTRTGVERVPRVKGVLDGMPVLEDGQIPKVSNIIWCTGFNGDFSWIKLPIVGKDGGPRQDRGIVEGVRGIYFVGLPFQYSESSTLLYGAARDAKHVVDELLAREDD